MKTLSIILVLFLFAGCQKVVSEDGRTGYQFNSVITNTGHAVVDVLDMVARPICEITEAACGHVVHVGEAVVGIERVDEPEPVEKPEGAFDALIRVLGVSLPLLLAA